MADEKSPIIVKRIKKGGHGAHGGAWKVAYADFVTAMMAFFLLLWLLNSVTEEQLEGISNYFAPTAVSSSSSGAGGMLGGQMIGEGASQSTTSSSNLPTLPPPTVGMGGDDFTDPAEGLSLDETQPDFPSGEGDNMGPGQGPSDSPGESGKTAADQAAQEAQEASFENAAQALRQAIQAVPDLKALQDSLMIEETPDGLRIQLTDQDRLAMFPSGSSAMYEHTRVLLRMIAEAIKALPNKIIVTGHTDNAAFLDPTGYSSWELSADRALASRRVLLSAGVAPDRIDGVIGKADTDPLIADNPADPRNRRVSIVLLRDAELYEQAQDERVPTLPSIIELAPAENL